MGASYSVDAEIMIKDGKEKELVKAFKKFVKDGDARYHDYKPSRVKTADDVFYLLLAGHQKMFHIVQKPAANGWTIYRSDFDASYGWGPVMIDAFYKFAPFLEVGSVLSMSADDENATVRIVEGGEVEEE